MAYENSGVLFRNDRKERDNQPDYTGKFTDSAGKEWRLAAWIKEGQKGKYMSIKASEPQAQGEQPQTLADAAQGGGDMDSEIPF